MTLSTPQLLGLTGLMGLVLTAASVLRFRIAGRRHQDPEARRRFLDRHFEEIRRSARDPRALKAIDATAIRRWCFRRLRESLPLLILLGVLGSHPVLNGCILAVIFSGLIMTGWRIGDAWLCHRIFADLGVTLYAPSGLETLSNKTDAINPST